MGNPYLTHDWLWPWWRAYREERDSLLIVCCHEDGGGLVGVLPLFVRRSGGVLGVTTLAYLGRRQAGPGYVTDPDHAEAVAQALAAHMATTRDTWDVLSLEAVDRDSLLIEQLMEQCGDGDACGLRAYSACPDVDISGTFDEFLRRNPSAGKAFRKPFARLKRDWPTTEVEVISDEGQLEEALQDARRLFESSMQRRFDRPFESSARDGRFMSEASRLLLANGGLRLMFLKVDGKRIAFEYQLSADHTLYDFRKGFDDEWAHYSVGTLALGCAIEGAIQNGYVRYDLGIGCAEYKRRWGAKGERQLCDLRLYGRSVTARSVALKDSAVRTSKRVLKPLVPASILTRIQKAEGWNHLVRAHGRRAANGSSLAEKPPDERGQEARANDDLGGR